MQREVVQRFWMVYVEAGDTPRHRHATIEEARAEAERLAHKIGQTVYILESIEIGRLASVTWKSLPN